MNTGRVLSEHHKKYIEDLNSQCTIQIIGTKLSDHGIWKCLAHDDPFKGLQHTETSISVSKKFRTYSSISERVVDRLPLMTYGLKLRLEA